MGILHCGKYNLIQKSQNCQGSKSPLSSLFVRDQSRTRWTRWLILCCAWVHVHISPHFRTAAQLWTLKVPPVASSLSQCLFHPMLWHKVKIVSTWNCPNQCLWIIWVKWGVFLILGRRPISISSHSLDGHYTDANIRLSPPGNRQIAALEYLTLTSKQNVKISQF